VGAYSACGDFLIYTRNQKKKRCEINRNASPLDVVAEPQVC
jgi:hypothetical protein